MHSWFVENHNTANRMEQEFYDFIILARRRKVFLKVEKFEETESKISNLEATEKAWKIS